MDAPQISVYRVQDYVLLLISRLDVTILNRGGKGQTLNCNFTNHTAICERRKKITMKSDQKIQRVYLT